ncbi:MAG: hypothetical protein Q8P28_04390 [Deltaproteobacteria bacterium]|nr:hypothetical protein [Deltaproteobacteria bacterium]
MKDQNPCACVCSDAYECHSIRYPGNIFVTSEKCECPCHDDEDKEMSETEKLEKFILGLDETFTDRKKVKQIAKLLFLAGCRYVEPVTLEVLPDEEIQKARAKVENCWYAEDNYDIREWDRVVSQDTNAFNHAKGQLYRLREEK